MTSESENDNPITLMLYFIREFGEDTPFIRDFLIGNNLMEIQLLLTQQLRSRTKNNNIPVVQFSDAILSALMTFAYKYRDTTATTFVIQSANKVFVDQIADQNEARYFEAAFWKRWCSQGLPDPNNIPLPLAPDYTDYTVETDAYILNNPNGYKKFPHW